MDMVTYTKLRRFLEIEGQDRNVRLLKHKLVNLLPTCIAAVGDSTSNDDDEWFNLTMVWLATKYPAFSFDRRVWSDTAQCYNLISPIQNGANGKAYAYIPGAFNKVDTPDKDSLDIAGDIDVCIHAALDIWTPPTENRYLLEKFGDSNRGWAFCITTANKLLFWWSPDGTALISATSNINLSGVLVNGQDKWLRATLDVDNGAGGNTVKFYTSGDGISWTQFGADVITAGTTSINAATVALSMGGREEFNGKVYQAIVKNGINGTVVASPNFGLAFPAGVTTFMDAEGNVWTIKGTTSIANGSPAVLVLNGSCAGKGIAYSADATRLDKQAAYEPEIIFINYGHNDSSSGYKAAYTGLCDQFTAKWPNVGVIGVTQNPQQSPRTAAQIATHSSTQSQVSAAMRGAGFSLVDAYLFFMDYGDYSGLINASDGVHPLPAGSQYWRDQVIKFLQLSGL